MLCASCQRDLPADDFRVNPLLRRGRHSWCKVCTREAARRSREKHRERYNAERRGSVRSRRGAEAVLKANPDAEGYLTVLLGDPCAYCGGPGGEIDHIEPLTGATAGEVENLTGACRSCNGRKQKTSAIGFLLRQKIRPEFEGPLAEWQALT